MSGASIASLIFVVIAIAAHLASISLAILRCRRSAAKPDTAIRLRPISLIRPVRGVDPFDLATLESGFHLESPDYELLFCAARDNDPAVPLVRGLIAHHPNISSQLLVGEDCTTANPKLNNVIKGWHAARHEWIVLADSNVLMPRDYLTQLARAWKEDTGLMCSPPIGSHAEGFWAELECAFLNTHQARWQLAADSVGVGFAQGKSMLWRRDILEDAGGIEALGSEIAEDAAATKIVRRRGLRVRLVDRPFPQPLGTRNARQVWDRQVRWVRLRRATFPHYFLPEVLTGSIPVLVCGAVAADAAGIAPSLAVLLLGVGWYAAEAVLARAAGWHMTILSPVAWIVRDAALPLLWVQAWTGNGFVWRGTEMSVAVPDRSETPLSPAR